MNSNMEESPSTSTKPETRPKPKPRSVSGTNRSGETSEVPSGEIASSSSTSSPDVKKPVEEGNNLVEALLKHNRVLDASLAKLDEKNSESLAQISELERTAQDLKLKSSNFDEEIAKLEDKNSSVDDDTSKEIQKYLAIYERLKLDEKLFKVSCTSELERLQEEFESINQDTTDDNKAELLAQLEKYRSKIEAGKVELAAINRKVATLKRQIEQVPNRMELREYRLRFSELYNQVSATHRSTKQFFSLYNSLEDTKRYLEKELSLLNSIVDSYQLASSTASGREDFLKQLQTIHDGMRETCSKVEKRLQVEKIGVEKVQLDLQKLVDSKVEYEKCLKELEAECKRNDHLLAECKALEKATAN